jgi:uncharacterized protein (DUF1330 family)
MSSYEGVKQLNCYFLAQIQINNHEEYQKYLDGVDTVFAKYNGKYLAVDSHPTVLEGEWSYSRVILIEFPNEEELRRWYDSQEYQTLVQHRLKAAKCDTLIVKGLD